MIVVSYVLLTFPYFKQHRASKSQDMFWALVRINGNIIINHSEVNIFKRNIIFKESGIFNCFFPS